MRPKLKALILTFCCNRIKVFRIIPYKFEWTAIVNNSYFILFLHNRKPSCIIIMCNYVNCKLIKLVHVCDLGYLY